MTPLEKVRSAFRGLPATIDYVNPEAPEPAEGEADERWISISHDLVDHESGVQACFVSEDALATLVAKFPAPRDKARVQEWLARATQTKTTK